MYKNTWILILNYFVNLSDEIAMQMDYFLFFHSFFWMNKKILNKCIKLLDKK